MTSNRKWLNTFLTCLFGGFLGLHRFYVGKIKLAIAAVVAFGVGVILAALAAIGGTAGIVLGVIGGLILAALIVWEIVDIVTICMHKYKDASGNFIEEDLK